MRFARTGDVVVAWLGGVWRELVGLNKYVEFDLNGTLTSIY